ncbi:hypothetical protein ACTFIY_005642 [Dictyostelium cf. discoideum]
MVVPTQSKTKTTPTTVAKAAPAKVATPPTTKPKTTTPPPTKTTVAKAAPVKVSTAPPTTTTTTTKPKTSEKPTEKKQDNKKQDNKKPEIKKNENNKKPEYKKPENKNNGKFLNDNKKSFNKETKAESSRDTFSKKFFGNKDKKETTTTEPKTFSSFQKRDQPFEKKETAQPYQKKFEIKKDKSTTTESSKDSDDIKIENSFSKNPTFSKAQGLYNKKVEEYLIEFKKSGSRDDQWKEKIQHTGTIRDRISAITLLIQKAPMYRLASLDILINLAAKKSEREREFAINSLKDLFVNSLLPNTKLKRFIERENIQDSKPVELVQWYFEDLLKSRYQAYIRLLEILSKDTVARIRAIATSTVQYLLLKKPEQEEVLLTLLVNKLGDEDGSNAGKAVKLLEKLLEAHPAMKLVVIREIELFLYRPNNSNKAQYNALYYLNKLQVACDKDGTSSVEMKEMSHRLIKLYFTFFTNKSNINSSAISLLIFGIRKAYSITKESTVFEPEQLKSLFKSCRKSTINKVIQTLCLIFEIKQHTPEISNDFYSNLYHTLNRMEKLSQFDQTSFLNLVFRAIKHDDNVSRSMAVLKRLIQFSFHQIVSFSAATLILVSELIKFNPIFGTMITDLEKKSTEEKQQQQEESSESTESYNPLHHDPVQANAHLSCLWEITLYSIHQHPTISSMANDLLRSNPIKFKGNPTVLFTLSAFLEKFVLSRQKNRKLKSSLKVSRSKIAEQYGMDSDNEEEEDDDDKEESEEEEEEEEKQTFTRPEEQFLKTFGDISNASGVVNKKKGSNVVKFVTDNEEMDKVLGYKEDENDSDEDLEDLDAEYSYEDLQASDFDDEEFESEIPKSKKPIAPSTKKSTKNSQEEEDDEDDEEFDVNDEEFASLNNEEFLDSIPDDDDDDDDDEDNGEDLDEDEDLDEEEEEDNVDIDEEEEDFDDEDGTNVDTPDFGDEEVEEDDVQTPDFGDEDEDDGEEDEEDEDEEKSDFLKSMQNNDAFMDADDFAEMLEKSGSSNSKLSYKKKGSKLSVASPSKKSTPSKQPKKSSTSKRKRF